MTTATFVAVPRVLATSVTLPIEMLRTADAAWASVHSGDARLDIRIAGLDDKPVSTQAGFQLQPDCTLAQASDSDVVFLPGLWRNPRPVLRSSSVLYPWLREQFERGALISAVGTGCCFLAEAGLLNGKAATTHWYYFDQFEHDYPQVQLKRQYFITQTGTIFCAASLNALADVTVHLVERFYDRETARHVERNFSHEIRHPYETRRYLDGQNLQHPDELIIEIQLWLQTNLQQPIDFGALAQNFGISMRSLNRRFRSATGMTPLQYLQRLRVDAAKELLQSTNLATGDIAFHVGYHDYGHFTRVFKKFLATTPSEYRATVRAKLFSTTV